MQCTGLDESQQCKEYNHNIVTQNNHTAQLDVVHTSFSTQKFQLVIKLRLVNMLCLRINFFMHFLYIARPKLAKRAKFYAQEYF